MVLAAVHVLLGSVVLTPCEFERRAGRGNTKNWKKSIRYCGRPLGEFLESYTSSEGRKCFKFVSSLFDSSTAKTSQGRIQGGGGGAQGASAPSLP